MALADEVAGLDEVAAAIGRTPTWLRRNWLKLHTAENFPRRIPSGWVWPRRAVEVWLRSAGRPLPNHPAANANQHVDLVEQQAAALKQRYGAMP